MDGFIRQTFRGGYAINEKTEFVGKLVSLWKVTSLWTILSFLNTIIIIICSFYSVPNWSTSLLSFWRQFSIFFISIVFVSHKKYQTMLAAKLCLLSLSVLAVGFSASGDNNTVVYWGSNNYYNNPKFVSSMAQGRLNTYCTSDVDIVVLSFLDSFPTSDTESVGFSINFANQCSETFSDGLLHCTQIGEDIKTCQEKGIKVLLSLGGDSTISSYGFTSESQGADFATTLWDYFAEGTSSERPFGDAVVDGFDLDIENGNQVGYVSMVNKLQEYYNSSSKDFYISAAPQCVYPDDSLSEVLTQSHVDFAFIQFYNNPHCNANGNGFNYKAWENFASSDAANKDIRLYVGVPAADYAAGSGYIEPSALESLISTCQNSHHFGGVMLWDASVAVSNVINGQSYLSLVNGYLKDESSSNLNARNMVNDIGVIQSDAEFVPVPPVVHSTVQTVYNVVTETE